MDSVKVIKYINSIDQKIKWNKFVNTHPNGNIFQTSEMFEVFLKTKNHTPLFFYIEESRTNDIIGVLSCVLIYQSAILRYFTSRCIVWGGPLVKGDDKQIASYLIKKLINEVRKVSIFLQFRNIFDISYFQDVFVSNGFTYEAHLDIIISLSQEWIQLKNNIRKSRLRNFTKSTNKGVVFHKINNPEEIREGYKLIEETYNRIKLPFPDYSHFKVLYDILNSPNNSLKNIYYFSAMLGKIMVGIRVILAYNGMLYDYYAGSSSEYKNYYPNDFLLVNILRWGTENRFNYFDFGGAGKPSVPYSVRDYKMQFGGELVEYGRYIKINKPILYFIGKVGVKVLGWIRSVF